MSFAIYSFEYVVNYSLLRYKTALRWLDTVFLNGKSAILIDAIFSQFVQKQKESYTCVKQHIKSLKFKKFLMIDYTKRNHFKNKIWGSPMSFTS
jgi:hypothetical protein